MILRRFTTALAMAGLTMLAVATPAFAHAELISSSPAKGATLSTAPALVTLTFNEPVSPLEVRVAGPSGVQWAVGQLSVQGPVVNAPVQPVGPAGPYVLSYKVKSEDGDDVTGTVEFAMAVAVTTTAAPTTTTTAPTTTAAPTTTTSAAPVPAPASEETDTGIPVWVWLLGGLVILLVAGLLLMRNRSVTETDSGPESGSPPDPDPGPDPASPDPKD